jgi:hypothetical protein
MSDRRVAFLKSKRKNVGLDLRPGKLNACSAPADETDEAAGATQRRGFLLDFVGMEKQTPAIAVCPWGCCHILFSGGFTQAR